MRAIAILLCAAAVVTAQSTHPPIVRASGDAGVSAKPDEVRIEIGVITQAETAEMAANANATQTNAMVKELKNLLGSAAELRTFNYSIGPQYRYAPNQTPTITGYTANNTVEVRTRNLDLVPKLIDSTIHSGANNIHSIQFLIHDPRPLHAQALREATQAARANAEAMASGLGLKLGRLVSIESADSASRGPIEPRAMAMQSAAPTPVESGTVDVRAGVIATFEVSQ